MTPKEIIEKKIAIVNNDIMHFSKQRTYLENDITQLRGKINNLSDQIGKKHSYKNLLEKDIENLEL